METERQMVHAFEHNGAYIALDEYSGAVHMLDKAAYRAVRMLSEGVLREDALAAGKAALGEAGAVELFSEIDALIADGQLFTDAPELEDKQIDGEIKALCLHAAHDCDLRCAYCFAATGSFHGGRKLMPPEVGRAALDFLIARSGSRNVLEVDFFGGEPLLNFDMVKETVRYGRELERKTGKRIRFTLTTNGMGLKDEVIEFLNEEIHNVVVSIDGRPEVHDALRKTVGGKGSHERILANARRFVRLRGDKSYYIRGTFTNRNLDFAKDVLYLFGQGFGNVSVEPAVLPEASPLSIGSEHLGSILEEYGTLADALIDRNKGGEAPEAPEAFFHFNVDFNGGPCVYKRLTGCGAGSEYLAVTPEGFLYPCHQFVGEERFLLGNVLSGELDDAKRKPFRRTPAMELQKCGGCWALPWCGGGCAANAWHQNGDIGRPYALECEMEKKRIECAAYLYAMKSDA
jgi:uncharacterized protein